MLRLSLARCCQHPSGNRMARLILSSLLLLFALSGKPVEINPDTAGVREEMSPGDRLREDTIPGTTEHANMRFRALLHIPCDVDMPFEQANSDGTG